MKGKKGWIVEKDNWNEYRIRNEMEMRTRTRTREQSKTKSGENFPRSLFLIKTDK